MDDLPAPNTQVILADQADAAVKCDHNIATNSVIQQSVSVMTVAICTVLCVQAEIANTGSHLGVHLLVWPMRLAVQ